MALFKRCPPGHRAILGLARCRGPVARRNARRSSSAASAPASRSSTRRARAMRELLGPIGERSVTCARCSHQAHPRTSTASSRAIAAAPSRPPAWLRCLPRPCRRRGRVARRAARAASARFRHTRRGSASSAGSPPKKSPMPIARRGVARSRAFRLAMEAVAPQLALGSAALARRPWSCSRCATIDHHFTSGARFALPTLPHVTPPRVAPNEPPPAIEGDVACGARRDAERTTASYR